LLWSVGPRSKVVELDSHVTLPQGGSFSEAKLIAALLSQVEELIELGRMAQGEDESHAELAVRQLENRYPQWYSAALVVLPEDLRGSFVEQYEAKRPTLGPRVKQFIARPRQPWALYESVPRFLRGHGGGNIR